MQNNRRITYKQYSYRVIQSLLCICLVGTSIYSVIGASTCVYLPNQPSMDGPSGSSVASNAMDIEATNDGNASTAAQNHSTIAPTSNLSSVLQNSTITNQSTNRVTNDIIVLCEWSCVTSACKGHLAGSVLDKCSICNKEIGRLCQGSGVALLNWVSEYESCLFCPHCHPCYTSDPRYGQLEPDIGAAVAAKKSTSVAKRNRTSMSNDAKVDLVFTKLDELDMIKQLLQCTIDAHAEEEKLSTDMAVDGTSNDNTVHSSTINAVSPSLSSLTVESCSLAMSCIDAVKKDITLACANTIEKKRADLAHSKTTEAERRAAKSDAKVQKMVMRGMNHVEKFATSLKNLGQRSLR